MYVCMFVCNVLGRGFNSILTIVMPVLAQPQGPTSTHRQVIIVIEIVASTELLVEF